MIRPLHFLLAAGLISTAAGVRAEDVPPSGMDHPSSVTNPPASTIHHPSPEIVGLHVGIAGYYKPGAWTPVEVQLRGVDIIEAGEVSVTVPDGDGVPSRVSAPLPCPAPAGGSAGNDGGVDTSLLLYTRFGRTRSELSVELRGQGRVVAHRLFEPGKDAGYRPAVPSDRELIVTVAADPLGVEEAVRSLQQEPERRTVVVRVEDFGELPDQWLGYEGIGAVVLSTSDPGVYVDAGAIGSAAEFDQWIGALDERVAALDEWVKNGGRLVFCLGRRAEDALAPSSEAVLRRLLAGTSGGAASEDLKEPLKRFAVNRLFRFVPGRLERTVPLRLTGELEAYCGSSVPVRLPREGVPVPHLVDVQGTVEARQGNLPLVVRRARGFGQVVFLAMDLDQAPFAEWEGRGRLVGALLDFPAAPVDDRRQTTAIMHYGFNDLAGQLRSALDQFPEVWRVPFWLVVGLILLYVAAIGPGDYFFLRRIVRRMRLTWITFPAIVTAFSLAAFLLAAQFKGSEVRVNQLDLVDVDVQTGRLRGAAWANVFSPRTDRYDLAFQPRLPGGRRADRAATRTAWLGLPGDALGGMNPRTTNPTICRRHYDFSFAPEAPPDGRKRDPADDSSGAGWIAGPTIRLENVPIQVWSTKSLCGRWTARTDLALEGRLAEEEGLPVGTITNTLPFPLVECLLAYGQHAYELGTLEPGASVRVGPNLRCRELNALVTGRQFVFDEEHDIYRPQITPYDAGSTDLAYILRAMMFFEAAGGRGRTGLSHRYQAFVDFSGLLKTNRAVLVGRAQCDEVSGRGHGAELLLDGRPVPDSHVRHTTVYRFVFPVESARGGNGGQG
jgi:hypothetical protein